MIPCEVNYKWQSRAAYMTEVDQELNGGHRVTPQEKAQWTLVSVRWSSYWEGTDEALGGMFMLACPLRVVGRIPRLPAE
jgi:hypothetical protein